MAIMGPCKTYVQQPSPPAVGHYKLISSSTSSLLLAQISVAMAQADIFAILGNKIVKNLKIFVEVDYLRSRGVLCQS